MKLTFATPRNLRGEIAKYLEDEPGRWQRLPDDTWEWESAELSHDELAALKEDISRLLLKLRGGSCRAPVDPDAGLRG